MICSVSQEFFCMLDAFCSGWLAEKYPSSESFVTKTSYLCGRTIGCIPICLYAAAGKVLKLAVALSRLAMITASLLASFALLFRRDSLRDPWYVHQNNLIMPMTALIASMPLALYGEQICNYLGIDQAWSITKKNYGSVSGLFSWG